MAIKPYLNGLYDYAKYKQHIGLHLERNCIVRLHRKYFAVRKHTVDLNVVSPLSEAKELKMLLDKPKILRKLANKNDYQIVFIDVGAHIGKYTIILSHLVHKVVALEPDPRNYTVLKYNIKLNNIHNVIALQIAASSKERIVRLAVDDTYTAQSSVVEECSADRSIRVQALPLDTLLERLGLASDTTYYIIKIDVEGHEVDILKGAEKLFHKTKLALIETTYKTIYSVIKLLPRNMYLIVSRYYPNTVYLVLATRDLVD